MNLKNKVILLVYMAYLGDTISVTPFLEAFRREAAGSKIILVMDANFLDTVRYNPNVDEIIPVKRKELGVSGMWALGRRLASYHADIFFPLHGTLRTTLLGLMARARCWSGEPGTRCDRFFMDVPVRFEDPTKHSAEKYVTALGRLLGKEIQFPYMHTYSCEAWDAGAEKFFKEAGVKRGEKMVGISVGSTLKEKDWPAERFGEVAAHFADLGYRPVFFGVKSELPLVERAVAGLSCKPVIAAGKLSMGEFIAAASWCFIAFTNDSGPLYVFDSRGVPTVSLFGPSSARHHHPIGPRSVALASTDMPITQDHVNHTVRDGNYVPIDHIPAAEVIRAGEWALGLSEDKEGRYEKHFVVVGQ